MANENKSVRVAQYLVAKNGTTKYLKFDAAPNAPQATKDLVENIKKAIGGDVLYINIFDSEFKTQHKIPDFVKGSVSAPLDQESPKTSKGSKSKDSSEEPNW